MGEKANKLILHSHKEATHFTPYQIVIILSFGLMLFTIVVDYMTMPALSAILLPELEISIEQFGLIISAYAFSVGISSSVATSFADRFDRKQLLLIYYGRCYVYDSQHCLLY